MFLPLSNAFGFSGGEVGPWVGGWGQPDSSVRALYAKKLTDTDTSFTLAAYRYSTEGYRTLTDHVQDISVGATRRTGNSETRTDLTVNQTLGDSPQFGSLYLNASDQHYRDRGGSHSFSAGYSNNWRDLNYNISLSKTLELGTYGGATDDTQLSVSISFPLGSSPRAPRAYVEVSSYSGVKTGFNGYAVLPNAQPYRVNWVSLDTRNLGGEIELDNATQQLVPRRGSIVRARFEGSKGRRAQFEIFDQEGKAIPFGAALKDAEG